MWVLKDRICLQTKHIYLVCSGQEPGAASEGRGSEAAPFSSRSFKENRHYINKPALSEINISCHTIIQTMLLYSGLLFSLNIVGENTGPKIIHS